MKYLVFLFISVISTSSVVAATYSHRDTINKIGSILIRADGDYILLNGFSSAGTCPKSGDFVVARFPSNNSGNRAYSLALSAKMANKNVNLSVDDENKNSNGYCFVKSISVAE